MEDLLELYQMPYDVRCPVVCMDELGKQLLAETRVPLPVQEGHPARYDYEYERKGVCSLFVFVEPRRGWRKVFVRDRRTKVDWALCVRVIPNEVSFEDAAALGVSGLSAWIALVENAQIAAGQRVLIHAGAGGVGCLALQIAALRGAEVWTTCSAKNADWCRTLGAYRTIDYQKADFSSAGQIFDAVLDTIGGPVHKRSAEVLKPNGKLAFLNADPVHKVTRKDIQVLPTDVRATQKRLLALLSLVAQGRLKVPVEARFPLARAAEAYELSRTGHARGKILLTML